MELKESMQREFDLVRRDIERGASVVPYIAVRVKNGEEYILPFFQVLECDEKLLRQWAASFQLFGAMHAIQHYVLVTEAWAYDLSPLPEDKRDDLAYIRKHCQKMEAISVVGVSKNQKLLWKSSIARDGSLVVCSPPDQVEDDAEVTSGILTELMPPEELNGTMPETLKPSAYKMMNRSRLVVIAR